MISDLVAKSDCEPAFEGLSGFQLYGLTECRFPTWVLPQGSQPGLKAPTGREHHTVRYPCLGHAESVICWISIHWRGTGIVIALEVAALCWLGLYRACSALHSTVLSWLISTITQYPQTISAERKGSERWSDQPRLTQPLSLETKSILLPNAKTAWEHMARAHLRFIPVTSSTLKTGQLPKMVALPPPVRPE